LAKLSAESFFRDREPLFQEISRFQGYINPIVREMNKGEQTNEGNQLFVDRVVSFYSESILSFYEKHRGIVGDKSIDEKIKKISELLSKDSANPRDPDRVSTINTILETIQKVIYEVKEAAQRNA